MMETMPRSIYEFCVAVWERQSSQGRYPTPLDWTPEERAAQRLPASRPKRPAPQLYDLRFIDEDGVVYAGHVWNALVERSGALTFNLDQDGEWEPMSLPVEWALRKGCYCKNEHGQDIARMAVRNEVTRQATRP